MGNAIVVLLFVLVMVFAIKSSLKHFRGQGGCCGGGPEKEESNRLL